MALTVTIDALRREAWRKELFADVIDDLYFMRNGLMGEGTNNIVQTMNDVKKEMGDTVTFGLSLKLSGNGIVGDSVLEGSEEAITTYNQSVVVDQCRNAVSMTGRLDEQKASYNMRKDAKEKVSTWLKEYIERNIFLKLGGVTTTTLTDTNGVVYSGRAAWSNTPNIVPAADEAAGTGVRYVCADAAGIDSLAATDILTTALISAAKTKAKTASPMIRPLRVEGKDYYVMFIHPNQAYDLKNASGSVWAQAQREAQVRGDSNPVFTGALGIWDGVILYEHEYVPTAAAAAKFSTAGTAAAVRAYRALLCGQQAAVMAQTNKTMFLEDENFDYKNRVGFAAGIIGGIQKSAFNSIDYGVISVDTASSL